MEKIESIEQLDALGVKICEMLQVETDKASIVVPETLQQIASWILWGNFAQSVVCILVIISFFIIAKQTSKNLIEKIYKEDELFTGARISLIIISVICILFSSLNLIFFTIPAFIKALVAPNIVIIEQLGGLVK